uniref:Uncharacterized protein n=1 Tax=Rhizophora mucronata TaxID=61149 RepID=A0A2P2M5W9_RHIMU
MKDSFESKI